MDQSPGPRTSDPERTAEPHSRGPEGSHPDPALDRLAELARSTLDAPIALVSLVEQNWHRFLGGAGHPAALAERGGMALSHSYCRHTVERGEPLVVEDAREHPLLRGNPAIAELNAISYLGVPLAVRGGPDLGTLCVIDHRPRRWTEREIGVLEGLTVCVVTELQRRSAEQRSRELGGLLERISDAFVSLDRDWRYTYVNRRAGELYGRDPASLVGRSHLDEHPGAADDAFFRAWREAMRSQRPARLEAYHEPWGRWLESRVYPSPDGVSVFFTDVTERRRAEAALRESEQRFRDMAETIREVFHVAAPDLSRVEYVSPAYREIWGRDPLELQHNPMAFADALLPEDRPQLQAYLDARLRGEPAEAEYRIRRPDGEVRWIHDRIYPVLDDAGRVVRTVGVAEDVTARKRAERELRTSRERLALALAGTGQGLWDWDLRTDRVHYDPQWQRMLGYEPGELEPVPATWSERVHPDDREDVLAVLQAHLDGEIAAYESEHRMRHRDGRWIWVLDRGQVVERDQDGRALRMAGTHTDITGRKRVERALQESELRFRQLAENMDQVFWMVTQEHRLLYVSPAYERVWGRPRRELEKDGVRWPESVHPDDHERVRAASARAHREGTPFDHEYRIVRPDGEVRWVRDRGFALRDAQGRVYRMAGLAEDVTEARGTARRERTFAQVLDESRSEIYLFDAETLRFVRVNRGARENLGYSMDQLRAMTPADLEPGVAREQLEQRLAPLRSGEREVVRFETLHRRSDGSTYPADVEVQLARAGEQPVFMALVLDISERRAVEESLRRTREQLQRQALVFETMSDAVVLSHQGLITDWNPAAERIFGYSRDAALGQPVLPLLTPDLPPELPGQVDEVLRTERRWSGEHVFRRSDGSPVICEVLILPVRGQNGRPPGTLSICRDVTAHRRLEEQLLQSQKMEAVGRLAGGVAHDFNNILTAIRGFTQLLRYEDEPPEERAGYLAEIDKAATRAAELTRQLLAFSRKQVLKPQVIDLNEVVAGMQSMLRRLLGEDLELVPELADDLGRVEADPGQLEQVIVNLAVNARDAMPQGGELRIRTRAQTVHAAGEGAPVAPGRYVVLSVSDTGIGMDQQTLERAFEPFFTTKEVGKGTGLGLSTVYGIVRQSGGYVDAQSEPGRGSTFQVYLPVAASPVETEAALDAVHPLPAGQATILLAEDETAVRRLARKVLERAGYTVLDAPDGVQALQRAREHEGRLSLLLTDVVMPRMSGQELATQMQRLHPGIRILFMSGYTEEAIERHGSLQAGADLLSKPFSPRRLLEAVRAALDPKSRLT